jgi:uncharacterized protein
MRPVLLLAELNDADLVVDGITNRLAHIVESLRPPAELTAARRALAEAEAELARNLASQQEREADQERAATKLANAEHALYAGKVRSPKELEDLQREQQQLRRQESRSEDDLLEALLAVEAATEKRDRLQAEYDRLAAAWEITRTKLRAEQAKLVAQLSTAQARQAATRRAVPATLLPLYDSLRSRRGGRAVSQLDGAICQACGVASSPGILAAARDSDELVYCDNCGRLIWAE